MTWGRGENDIISIAPDLLCKHWLLITSTAFPITPKPGGISSLTFYSAAAVVAGGQA